MDNLKVLGIDLAKNIFQLHGADSNGVPVFKNGYPEKRCLNFLPISSHA